MSRRSASISAISRRARVGIVAVLVAACQSQATPTPAPSASPSGPFELDITVEATTAAGALLGPAGGTITTTSDAGVTYEFVVPPLALPGGTQITMTPISAVGGLPLSGGFVAGVDFAPSGLVLAQPGTLTISVSRQPTADQRLVGFGYGDGAESFHLAPAKAGPEAITLSVSHFSTVGAGFGTTQDIEALWILQSNDPETPATSQIAVAVIVEAFMQTPRDGAEELAIMERWFDFVILPELEAVTTDAQLVSAVSAYETWRTEVPEGLDMYQVMPGGRDAPSLVSRRASWEAAFAAKARLAMERNLQLCAAPGIASARVAALDNALFWHRVARWLYFVATEGSGLDLAAFQGAACAQGLSQNLTLDDPLTTAQAANLDVTFALRFTDGQVVPGNFVVTALGEGAAMQFPERTAASPPGFYSGVVTPTGAGAGVSLGLNACYAGGDVLVLIGLADEICVVEVIERPVGLDCASDPLTITSIGDDPDKIYVVFDGASTCRLVGEVGDNHFPGDGSDVVLSIDTDPNETTWDGEDSDDDSDGLNWQEVGGFGQDFASGDTQTFRSRHVATGQVFEVTVTVRVEQTGGRNTRMTVEDVRITAAD